MNLTFRVILKFLFKWDDDACRKTWNLFHWLTDVNNLEYTIMINTLLLYLIGQMCQS